MKARTRWMPAAALSMALLLGGCAPEGQVPESPAPTASTPELPITSAAPMPTESAPPETAQPPEAAPSLQVTTDWSKLTPREPPEATVGGRWYAEYVDALRPQDNYGMLIPYAGLRLMDNWPASTGCLYGLMTARGLAVTDAVYSSIYRPGYYKNGGYSRFYHDLLVLTKGVAIPGDEWDSGEKRITVAAADGSWVTEQEYLAVSSGEQGLVLLEQDGLTLMDGKGRVRYEYTPDQLGLSEAQWTELRSNLCWHEGMGGEWEGDYLCLGWADGDYENLLLWSLTEEKQVEMTLDAWLEENSGSADAPGWDITCAEGETTLTRGEERYTIPYGGPEGQVSIVGELVFLNDGPSGGYRVVYTLSGQEVFSAPEGSGVTAVTDSLLGEDSAMLLEVVNYKTGGVSYYFEDATPFSKAENWVDAMGMRWYRSVSVVGGLAELLDRNTAEYYDLSTGECVFRTYLNYEDE